jgi:hypothetical protein
MGAVAWHAELQVSTAERAGIQVAAILNAPDAVMKTARVVSGGTATVVMSRSEHALVFTAAGLRRLPPSRCYQLWLMGPAGDRPAGMLPLPADGMTKPVVAVGMAPGDSLALTVEPDGGTAQPTATPVLVLPLD